MGIFNSKNKFNSIPKVSSLPQPNKINQTVVYEDESLVKLRRQFHTDAETFVLNNLFLSIQFFENYEREIEDLRISNVSPRENRINSLLTEQQKHCLIPDTLHELIDKKVRFQPEHGPTKYHSEPLHVQRILIAYDNVEVYNPSETSEYSSPLEGPIYRCVMESSNTRGYVRLKLKEIETKKKLSEKLTVTAGNTIPSPSPEIIRSFSFDDNSKDNFLKDLRNLKREFSTTSNNDDVFTTPPQNRKIKRNSNLTPTEKKINNLKKAGIKKVNSVESNFNDIKEEPTYEYATIKDHYTLKPLKEVKLSNNKEVYSCSLPNDCITSIEVQVFDDDDEDDENDDKLNKNKYQNVQSYRQRKTLTRKKINLFKKIAYLNSVAFTQHFGDVFIDPIGDTLGFTQETIQISMMQGSIVYTDVMENGHVINYEIIPSLTSSWPDEAYEWSYRARVAVPDFRTKMAYRWPTPGMINRAKSLPCHIYPIGFIPKRGYNPQSEFQWKLAFPAAERFLESYLSHPQLRCYLFLLTFYKSFIEPKETKLGLTADHIRAFLFWECEKDYVRWPEDRLGEKIIILLKKLRTYLESQNLPDYFIPTRNLFENIPTCNLLIAHRKIADILENPVIYTLRALRNLKYTHKQFYPVIDYKQIYEIIETDSMLQKTDEETIIYKRNVTKTPTDIDEAYDSDETEEYPDIQTKWYNEVYRRIQEEKLQQKQQKITCKRRSSIDSINYDVKPGKTLETLSKIRILKLFIRHFLEMARRSDIFDATQQGFIYLKHAKNLTTLLREERSGQEDADDFFVLIRKVEDNLKISLSKEKLPKIPARNIQLYNNGRRATRLSKPQLLYGKTEENCMNTNYANVDNLSDTSSSEKNRKRTISKQFHENNNNSDNKLLKLNINLNTSNENCNKSINETVSSKKNHNKLQQLSTNDEIYNMDKSLKRIHAPTSTDNNVIDKKSHQSLNQITISNNFDTPHYETSTDYDVIKRSSKQSLDKITIVADVHHNTYSELLPSRIILQNHTAEEESTDL